MSMSQVRFDRDETGGARRAQVWCPGIAFVTPQGDIRMGPSAGYSSRDPAFRRLCCGRQSGVSYWTHVAWLVARSTLTPETVAEHGIILPETLIDRDTQPHARRWLSEQPLVCVSGATWARLAREGVQTFRIALDVTGHRKLRFDRRGGTALPTALTVSLDRLSSAGEARGGLSSLDFGGNPSPVDRVLRFLSGGVLDEAAVMNAFDARSLIENGYGYRGALEGHFADVEAIARELGSFNDLFGQIFERATGMIDTAQRVSRAVVEAPPNACRVPVALYGTARVVPVRALRLPDVERLIIDGVPTRDLELPPERRWTVGPVERWSPSLPPHLTLVANV